MDKHYADRVAMLVAILPAIAAEPRFALKGGTAINLFEHDLPRLSVDIDLTWLPVQDFETDARQIEEALSAIGTRLSAPPLDLRVQLSGSPGSRATTRLVARRDRTQVQIETTPVMRGTVHPVRNLDLRPRVEAQFGSARVPVLHFADLYGGKLAACLARQHPRDLFDVGLLLDGDRFDETLWRTFLVYLTASPKPAAEMLSPSEPAGFDALFDAHFRGMTSEPTTAAALLDVRARLLARIASMLDATACAFLESVERETPDFELIGLPQAGALPGVRRKLDNLARRSDAKRRSDLRKLLETMERVARS